MDHTDIWKRFIGISELTPEDRKVILSSLGEETIATLEQVSYIGRDEIATLLASCDSVDTHTFIDAITPVLFLTVLDGMLLSFVARAINPTVGKAIFPNEHLFPLWKKEYENGELQKKMGQMDPIIRMMLSEVQALRTNQMLAFQPEIIKSPYEYVEKIAQILGWGAYQGYYIGLQITFS